MVPPLSQNKVGLGKQITLPILHYIRSRLMTLLKATDAPVLFSDIFDVIVSFKFIIYSFQIFIPELHALHCLGYINCFGLNPVTTAF
jgi:hypothetical protein